MKFRGNSIVVIMCLALCIGACKKKAKSPTAPSTSSSSYTPTRTPTPGLITYNAAGFIYTIRSDGTNPTNIGTGQMPVWSPNGSKIAFAKYAAGFSEIHVMNPDGSGVSKITDMASIDGEAWHPSWSPDGLRVVFRYRWLDFFNTGIDTDQEIYIINSDGTARTRLTDNANGINDWDPKWSPDGTSIAFVTNRDGNTEIYVMKTGGANQTNLTNNPAMDGYPSWSPDGSKIAFARTTDGIYAMNADGSSQTQITDEGTMPVWSGDGKKIAFISSRDGNKEIYVMNSDGTNLINITNSVEGMMQGEQSPSWRW